MDFISGSAYSIKELFGEDTKIVIPDLQRDYCWGDKAYSEANGKQLTELVSYFVKNILEIYKNALHADSENVYFSWRCFCSKSIVYNFRLCIWKFTK